MKLSNETKLMWWEAKPDRRAEDKDEKRFTVFTQNSGKMGNSFRVNDAVMTIG